MGSLIQRARTGIPFVGFLLDKRTTFEASLVLLVSGVAFGLLGMVGHVGAQTVSIALFVILRPLMYTFGELACGSRLRPLTEFSS